MAQVKFKRIESSTDINNIPIIDGQITYTKDGKTYLDYEAERVVINGTPETVISDTSTNAVANSTVKNYVDSNIETVSNMIHNGTILWSNPTPNEQFSTQEITLSSDNYDCYEIIFRQSTNVDRVFNTGKILKGYGTLLDYHAGQAHYRVINYTNDTSLYVGEGVDLPQYGTTSSNNTQCIPLYVIGYNTGLF